MNPEAMEQLPWSCDFGETVAHFDLCGFKHGEQGTVQLVPHEGTTPTEGTGPPPENIEENGEELLKINS